MKKYKHLLAVLLAIAMILSMAACGGTSASAPPAESGAEAPPEAAAPANEAPDAVEPAEEIAEVSEVSAEQGGFVSYSLPLAEDHPTLQIWSGEWYGFLSQVFQSYSDADFWKLVDERLGVNCDFTISLDPATDISLIIASGSVFDLMQNLGLNYSGGDTKALSEGYVIDIAQRMDQAPNYNAFLQSDPAYLKNASTDNGAIAGFLTAYVDAYPQQYLWIYKDWLDQCGIAELPQTIDEYHDVLTAMHNEFNVAPLWIGFTGGFGGSVFGSAYGVSVAFETDVSMPSGLMVFVEDGVVKYSPYEEGFRSYLELMHQWWEEGLLYKDFMTGDQINGARDFMMATGIGVTTQALQQYRELSTTCVGGGEWCGAYTPVLNRGDTTHFMEAKNCFESGRGFYIPSESENIDLSMKFMDYFYSPEGQIVANYGFEGVSMHFDGDTPVLETELLYNNDNFPNDGAARINYLGHTDTLSVTMLSLQEENLDETAREAVEIWTSNMDSANMYPNNVSMTDEELDGYKEHIGDLITYVSECMSRFIIGEMSLDDDTYDAFIQKIDELGGREIVGYYQAAYDRFMER